MIKYPNLIYIFLISLIPPVIFQVQPWPARLVLSACSSAVPSLKVLKQPLSWGTEGVFQGWKREVKNRKKIRSDRR